MKIGILTVGLLTLMSQVASAQTDEPTGDASAESSLTTGADEADVPERPRMPIAGLAASATYQLSWFDDGFAHGPGTDFRIVVSSGDTYPVFVVIAGFSFSHLFGEGDLEADVYAPYVMLGTMIPLDLVMETPAEFPRAAGIPVWAALKPADVLSINGNTLVGWGARFGIQLPIPPVFGFNIEYDFASYTDDANMMGFGDQFSRHSITFAFQLTAAPFF